jgi:hypothetical protein
MAHTQHTINYNPTTSPSLYSPAFRLTLTEGEVTARQGQLPRLFQEFLERKNIHSWAFFSACNPHSLVLAKEANRQRHETLCRLLEDEGVDFVSVRAVDYEGETDGVLVLDLAERRVEAVARAFAQRKYLYGDQQQGELRFCEALEFSI